MTITGPGAGQLTIDGNGSRVLGFATGSGNPPATAEVSDLTLTGGAPGISAQGVTNVAVRRVVLSGNTSPITCGGGIQRTTAKYAGPLGTLTVADSTVSGNATTSTSGASGGGGGICSLGGTVRIENSVISGNSARNFGGGVLITDGDLEVVNSTLSGNHAGVGATVGDGGAIATNPGGGTDVSISGSRITDNDAVGDGGGISIAAADGNTSIVASTVSGNSTSTGSGGGLFLGYAGGLTVDSSTFSANAAGDSGGGLFVKAPTGATSIRNTTVTGNTGNPKGAGIYSFGYYDKPVAITNSTIAFNSGAGTGGGIFRQGYDGQGAGYEGPDVVRLSSTIVANNFQSLGPDLAQGPLSSPTGSFAIDHTIIGSTAGGATITETEPGTNLLDAGSISLGPLGDNGGPTQTMLPALDGPAIDAGAANALSVDQRGLPRSVVLGGGTGDGTDIGAVELADGAVRGAGLSAKKKQKAKGKKVVIAVEAGAEEAVTVTATGKVKLGKKKLPLRKGSADVAASRTATLKLKPAGKKAARDLLEALRGGKKVKASIAVTFADVAGNEQTLSAKVTLTTKK